MEGRMQLSTEIRPKDRKDSLNGPYDDSSIRIGIEYQAICPMIISEKACPDYIPEKAVLVWKPSQVLTDEKIDEFLFTAEKKFGYKADQALGMLFWHRYNITTTIEDLPNFTPFTDAWNVEDKVLFEQAFAFHGKNFSKIRLMLPDKTIASLVKYYYSWKKKRNTVSLIDKRTQKLRSEYESMSEESDVDVAMVTEPVTENRCAMCNEAIVNDILTSNEQPQNDLNELCRSCETLAKHAKQYQLDNEDLLPVPNKIPPRGIYLNLEDISMIAASHPNSGEFIMNNLERQLCVLKRTVQKNKAIICKNKELVAKGIEHLRPKISVVRNGGGATSWPRTAKPVVSRIVQTPNANIKVIPNQRLPVNAAATGFAGKTWAEIGRVSAIVSTTQQQNANLHTQNHS